MVLIAFKGNFISDDMAFTVGPCPRVSESSGPSPSLLYLRGHFKRDFYLFYNLVD